MGERVWVDTKRVEPAAPGEDAVRLDYAKPDVNPWFPTVWKGVAWVRYVVDEFVRAARPVWARALGKLGGVRQVGFAVGLACVLGALGYALSRDEAVTFWMVLGALLIGFSLRVPLRP
jgi:hypothetical protein